MLVFVHHRATAVTVPGFLSKNWPPRCQEIIAPNSTVLTKELLEELCDVMRLRGQRLDKAKLKAIIRSLDRYYQASGPCCGCSCPEVLAYIIQVMVLDCITYQGNPHHADPLTRRQLYSSCRGTATSCRT